MKVQQHKGRLGGRSEAHTTGGSAGRRQPAWLVAVTAVVVLLSSCGASNDDGSPTRLDSDRSDGAVEVGDVDPTLSGRVQAGERDSSVGGGLTQEAFEEAEQDESEAMSEDSMSDMVDESMSAEHGASVGGGLTQSTADGEAPGQAPARIDRPSRVEPEVDPDGTFRDYGTNPFVDTEVDPLSTFAVDVDDASYVLARQWLENGTLPDPASVRVEEFVNRFEQDYSAPRNETFAVFADGAPHPFIDDDTYLVRIGVASEEISNRDRDDANLTLVVDVSGSMNDASKLETVIESLHVLVDELDDTDAVAIVAYSNDAWVHLEPTSIRDRRTIHDAIDRLRAGGSTNAEAGLELGFDLADEMYGRNANNKVILLSDGVANVGATNAGGIFDRISESSRAGIDLIAIGVGISGYNDVLLEQLANQGNGFYAYVDTVDQAERLFSTDLVSTLQVVAQDVKIQVEFNSRNVIEYRLLGFENRDIADDDFRNDRVDAGEIGAGHTVTALYEVRLARGVDAGSGDEIGVVNLRWMEPDGRRAEEISGVLTTDVLHRSFDDASAHFRLSATAATFAEVLRESRLMPGVTFRDVLDVAEEIAEEMGRGSEARELADLIDIADRLAGRR